MINVFDTSRKFLSMAGVDITKLGTSEIENAQQTAVELGIYDIVQEKKIQRRASRRVPSHEWQQPSAAPTALPPPVTTLMRGQPPPVPRRTEPPPPPRSHPMLGSPQLQAGGNILGSPQLPVSNSSNGSQSPRPPLPGGGRPPFLKPPLPSVQNVVRQLPPKQTPPPKPEDRSRIPIPPSPATTTVRGNGRVPGVTSPPPPPPPPPPPTSDNFSTTNIGPHVGTSSPVPVAKQAANPTAVSKPGTSGDLLADIR